MSRDVRTFPLSTRVDAWGGPVSSEVRDNPGAGRTSLRLSGCRHLLILIHGFNNSQAQAQESYELFYARIEEHLRSSRTTPDAVAFFHWPGNYAQARFDAAAWYHIDIERARDSARRLAEYLAGFTDPASLRVTMVGHSLGCRLILLTLKSLNAPPIPNVEIVSLMAPAIPVELVSNPADPILQDDDLTLVVGSPRRVLKFFSRKDWALWGAFPAGQEAAYLGGIEKRYFAEAVGLNGNPASLGVSLETTNGHGDYWKDVRTTNELSRALDPAYHTLPPPHRIAGRELGSAALPEGRRLFDRT